MGSPFDVVQLELLDGPGTLIPHERCVAVQGWTSLESRRHQVSALAGIRAKNGGHVMPDLPGQFGFQRNEKMAPLLGPCFKEARRRDVREESTRHRSAAQSDVSGIVENIGRE